MGTYGDTKQNELIESIAHHLRIPRQEIELVYTISGTVIMMLEMPDEAAFELHRKQLEGDPFMQDKRIIAMQFRPALKSGATAPELLSPSYHPTDTQSVDTTSEKTKPEQKVPTHLRRILAAYFDEEELRNLCFDLHIDYGGLPGESTTGKARELVAHCERHGRIPDLMKAIAEIRPNAHWQDTPQ